MVFSSLPDILRKSLVGSNEDRDREDWVKEGFEVQNWGLKGILQT
jgi:hypothetical protein